MTNSIRHFIQIVENQSISRDLIITLPATVKWQYYEKELKKVKDNHEVMRFSVANLPTKNVTGGKCYVVHQGFIKGWMTITGTHEGEFTCSTTGKTWKGKFIERAGTFHHLDKSIPHKGFQGFRYFSQKLDETYSTENGELLRYMKNAELDPYAHWNEICQWLEDNDMLYEVSDFVGGEEIESAEQLEDEDPEIFYKLPDNLQAEIKKDVIETVMSNDPAEAPTWAHMSLNKKQLLKRDTWLVHFCDDPDGIAAKGFIYGADQMDKLGLTSWYKNDSELKRMGGFNFAFQATSRYADQCASSNKYGRNAVLFQNSGVEAYHYGDEEDQVMFLGKDVNPKSIIVLTSDGSDWTVKSHTRTKRGEYNLFTGEFEQCVQWVIRNFAQYRKYLTRS